MPERPGPARVVQRFLDKIEPAESGCWLWTGEVAKNGYGKFYTASTTLAHRAAYEFWVDRIPPRLQIDHLCRVRRCVNPDHLEAVTQRENAIRGVSFSAVNAAKTHCPQGHEYDEANTYVTPHGSRLCRACGRQHHRRYRGVA